MQVINTTKEIEQRYLDSIFVISHSNNTIKTYKMCINKLRNYLKDNYQCDEIQLVTKVKNNEIDVYELLREYVIFLDKTGIKPSTIRLHISAIKGYFRYFGIRVNSDDCKFIVKIPKQIKTREIPLTREMILRVLHNSNPKLQTAILVAVSTGMRIGELVELRVQDVDFGNKPTKVYLRAEITKTRQYRETFLTEEATLALKDYLKRFFGWKEDSSNEQLNEKHIFGPVIKPKKSGKFCAFSAQYTLQMALHSLIKTIPELSINNENGRKAIHFHAFRKYFRTTVGNVCGRDYAEALMGHGFYMDTYYQLPEEKQRQMYLDAEPYLTISDFEKVEKNFKTLSSKYNNLETKVDDLLQYLRTNSIQVPEHLIQ